MKKKLTVDETNIMLAEAAAKDAKDTPVPINFTGLEPDVEGWDEYVEWVLKEGPPEEVDEEVV